MPLTRDSVAQSSGDQQTQYSKHIYIYKMHIIFSYLFLLFSRVSARTDCNTLYRCYINKHPSIQVSHSLFRRASYMGMCPFLKFLFACLLACSHFSSSEERKDTVIGRRGRRGTGWAGHEPTDTSCCLRRRETNARRRRKRDDERVKVNK